MSANKKAYARYRIIDSCLAGKGRRYWSKEDLIKELAANDFNIESRTLNFDLENMRHDQQLGFNAPIAYCRTNRGYYYTNPNYSIFLPRFTSQETQGLCFVVQSLRQQYSDADLIKQFGSAAEKILRLVRVYNENHQWLSHPVVDFEPAPFYKGMHLLGRLLQAIYAQQPLSITYCKFGRSTPADRTFHPYFLKTYKSRWYVLGYCQQRGEVITLALDRMEHITNAAVPYIPNTTFNAEEYFLFTIGVTPGPGSAETVILKFKPQQAPYIKTLHLHHTQAILYDEADALIIGLHVIVNYEFKEILMAYGGRVTIIEPEALRLEIADLHLEAWDENNFIESDSVDP